MERQIDHLVILVPDLASAIAEAEAAGFTVVPGGEHPGGTHNALIGFSDGAYLELIAFREERPDHWWYRYLPLGSGLVDLCLAVASLDEAVERLDRAGLAYRVLEGSRQRPDGYLVRWRIARPPAERTGELPFFIEDLTPRSERVPHGSQAEHANGARGLADVVLVSADTNATVAAWRALTGSAEQPDIDRELGVSAVRFAVGPHQVTIAGPEHPLLAARLARLGSGPVFARLWAWTTAELWVGGAHLSLQPPEG